MPSPANDGDNVPLNHHDDRFIIDDENHSYSDTVRDTHRSSASTLIADDVDLGQAAKGIHSSIDESLDKLDSPRNLRNGEAVLEEEQELEGLISNGGEGGTNNKKKNEGPVGWRDLPRKGQLAVLTIARLSEPLVQTSLQASLAVADVLCNQS